MGGKKQNATNTDVSLERDGGCVLLLGFILILNTRGASTSRGGGDVQINKAGAPFSSGFSSLYLFRCYLFTAPRSDHNTG